MTNEAEKRGRGRPKKEGSKRSSCNIRFDDEYESMLGELTYFNEKSRSEIMRDALKWYYNFNKSKF